MTGQITIEKLELTGFRAYLESQTFPLRRRNTPLSLAIFAPNGLGKSSLVDSLEYYFSKEGTLKRLGLNSSLTQAGIKAIRHVDAEKNKVKTSVHIWFSQGNDKFDDPRPISAPFTDAARRVLSLTKVPFVIRGYELRKFIDGTKPIDRYRELVAWLALDPLLAVQDKLKDLKRQVGEMAADTADTNERLRDLGHMTGGAISAWDESKVLDWLNTGVLAPLDEALRFEALSNGDPAFQELERLAETERKRAGLEMLRNLLATIEDLYTQSATLQENPTGKIAAFEGAIFGLKNAVAREANIRSTASESVFSEVWTSAQNLLESGTDLDRCPVCDTEFHLSPHRSRDRVCANLCVNLSKLEECRNAKKERENAETELSQSARDLGEGIGKFSLLAGSAYQYDDVATYREALQSWSIGKEAPGSKGAADTLARLHLSVRNDIEQIELHQGEHTYGNALDTVRRLLATAAELERIKRTKDELRTIRANIDLQAKAFGDVIVEHIRNLVDKLQNEISVIYKGIQGPHVKVPPIQIKLADEGAANQRRAQLLIDFADDHKEVMPGGYLSDSQIHTLALALRLAAIRLFNTEVKIIALDDIVTSYDADRRKNIAAVLNDNFGDFQIVLVTHDKHFFDLLNDHLAESHWQFKQIREIRPGVGPVFEDHKIRDEEIETKLAAKKDALNDIRKAEEEWLARICNDFRTPTTFQRNHASTRSEMAASLDKFLKESGLGQPTIPGFSRPFLESMQRGMTENLGSHHGDDPYVSASDGDAQTRWDEFKHFRSLFVCPECNHSRFERPEGWKKPVCAKCKTPFHF